MNYVISIVNPEALDTLTDICARLELPVTVTMYARGTAVQSMLELLGIESSEKRVVVAVATQEKTKKLIAEQRRLLHLGVPGHGMVIAVPIKSVGGGKVLAYLSGDEKNIKRTMPELGSYELIVAIANSGYTDMVMNVARGAGARGGTVLHGKGTGSKDAPKFHTISIADEKELVLIVAHAREKAEIMRAIIEKAGGNTPAAAIAFSLPTTEVAGFGLFDEEE